MPTELTVREGQIDYFSILLRQKGAMVWEPLVENGQLFWRCTGGTLPDNLRPGECQN